MITTLFITTITPKNHTLFIFRGLDYIQMKPLNILPETLKALEEARKPRLSPEELKKIEEESGLKLESVTL
jgi:hypothetical protein